MVEFVAVDAVVVVVLVVEPPECRVVERQFVEKCKGKLHCSCVSIQASCKSKTE